MLASTFLATALLALNSLVSATPVVQAGPRSTDGVPVVAPRAAQTSNVPKIVIYTDEWLTNEKHNLPEPENLSGFNVLVLAFLMVKGPADQAQNWHSLGASTQKQLKAAYKAAGVSLMVSSFGSTDAPTSAGVNAKTIGTSHAQWVIDNDLDGIDVDYEDMPAMNRQDGKAEKWLIDYTKALRAKLGNSKLITHAPVAPWFSAASYKSGAYVTVHKEVGNIIDWYNIQFYNQGNKEYTDCNGLLHKSSSAFPDSAVMQINDKSKANVPMEKIVIGKPLAKGQAANGYVDPSTLAKCITEAGKAGWSGGAMYWEYESKLKPVSLITGLVDTFKVFANVGGAILGGGSGLEDPLPTSDPTSSGAAKPTSTVKSSNAPTATQTDDAPAPSETGKPEDDGDDCGDEDPNDGGAGNEDPNDGGSGAGSCDGAEAWSKTAVYDGGKSVGSSSHSVTYDGWVWENKWWTQGETPGQGGDSDPWTKLSACPSSKNERRHAEEEEDLAEPAVVAPVPIVRSEKRNVTRAVDQRKMKMRKARRGVHDALRYARLGHSSH